MKRVITLILALIMVCGIFVSCKGSGQDENVSYTVKLTIMNRNATLYGPESVTVEDTEDDVTVLDVVMQYLTDSKVEYETATRTLSGKTSSEIISIDDAKKSDGVFWQVLINNKTASINANIEDGDDIVFFLDANADTESQTETEAKVQPVQTANDDYNG